MQSGSLIVAARRISIAFFSIVSFMRTMIKSSRNSFISRSSSSFKSRFERSSIRTITLEKSCAPFILIPIKDGSYCLSSYFTTAHVSKTILIPFIADCSLICYAIAVCVLGKDAEKAGNRFSVWIGGFFLRHLQSFFDSDRIFIFYPCLCRSKSEDDRPRRHFAGNFYCQPVVNRNFNCLRNTHKVNIA